MTRNTKEFVNHATARRIPRDYSKRHVVVLLAHCNGAATLQQQLNSLAGQTHRDWSLVISDDGSSDDWLEVATEFARSIGGNRTWLVGGPRKGFAQNFLHLARIAGPCVPYAAFCDQDDAWMPEKLERALAKLADVTSGTPAVYCSRTMICDDALVARHPSPLFERPPSFRNALVQNIGGGNTMVLNRPALDLVQDTMRHAADIVSHDWWVYQLVSGAGGVVIYDPKPSLLYRQHGQNLVGANDTFRARLSRIHGLLSGQYGKWNDRNLSALQNARHWLTKDARTTLDLFRKARSGGVFQRFSALRSAGLYRQQRSGTLALWLTAALKRL